MNAPEQIEIDAAGAVCFLGVQHRLAEQIERGRQVTRVQVAHRRHRFVDRLAGDEPRSELACEAILPDEPEDARLLAQPEKYGAQHQA